MILTTLEEEDYNKLVEIQKEFPNLTFKHEPYQEWIPFSYHFFDCFDLEICYYIDELKDHVSMFVFEEQGMKRREWSEEFKNNPAYELVDLKLIQ